VIPDQFRIELETLEKEYEPGALSRIIRFLSMDREERKLRHPCQKKARYVVAGLSTGPWMSLDDYPKCRSAGVALQKHHAEIKDEILARVRQGPLDYYRPSKASSRNEKWRSVYLARDGAFDQGLRAQFPVTMRLVDEHFQELLYPLGEVFFSALQPGAYISPHCDMANFFVCLHFGVDVPTQCALSVAGEKRAFHEQELYLFDQSYEHEAWNRSEHLRINLLFDLWHPGLSEVERRALAVCFRKMYDEVHNY
jgi:hypothetical protein